MRTLADLHDYQADAYAWLRHRTEGFVWMPLGRGKTVVAASAFADWRQRFPAVQTALVVGTKRIIELTWPDELVKWSHLAHLTYAEAHGPISKRVAAVASRPDILGLNYENLKWYLEHVPTSEWPDVLILDEVSKMKDHGTKRFKALLGAIMGGPFKRRIGLTATPAAESYVGLWAQEASISTKRRLGPNITAFREIHCRVELVGGDNRTYEATKYGRDAIVEKLHWITYNMDSSRYAELKRAREIDIAVEWTPQHRAAYDAMEEEFVLQLEEEEVAAANMAVRANKLRQLCAGCIYDEDGEPRGLDTTKLDAFSEVIEELHGEHALVFYQYRWERAELLKRLPKTSGELKNRRDLELWNAGKTPYLVLHPASAGHGLNLHESGCSVVVWYSLPWSLEHYLQANARIDRPAAGEMNPMRVYRLLCRDSIEEDVADRLVGKIASQELLKQRIMERQHARRLVLA